VLSNIILTNSGGTWYLNAGRVTREERAQLIEWCFEMWGAGWGEVDTSLDTTVFIFPRLAHANWFLLKWAD
jgi:hypothetical protein